MGLMSFLRNRAGFIIVGAIGLAIVAFLFSDAVHYGSGFLQGSRNEVGEVAGQSISAADYSAKLEQNMANFKQQSGQNNLNSQITSYIQENTWNQEISQIVLDKEINKLGLTVGTDESRAMIHGNNPNPQLVQAFSNPETGEFDRARLNAFLSNIQNAKPNDPTKAQWTNFIEQLIAQKKAEKYLSLVRNGLYVNSLEAKNDYEAKNKLANFKYIALNYSAIPDNEVKLTEEDFNAYYNEHKKSFNNPQEVRSFDYVSFTATPSAEDSAIVKKQIDQLTEDLKASDHDSLFVAVNADTKSSLRYQRKGQLDAKLDSVMFNASKGYVYGPYFADGAYKVAKLVDARFAPDSVKARHILLNPAMEGGLDKAIAKADSLKKVIQEGKSFAELAKTYSVDGSAAKGGDLGTFGPGAMVPVFEDAVFTGKPGDLKVVTSQFGVHLIEIQSQKGSSKEVKVAVVDKFLAPSNKTQSAAYAKAQAFLATVNKGGFDEEVKKQNLRKLVADDVAPIAASVPGLENAREVVRWAYKAKGGDVSDQVFEQGDQYVVARLTQIKEKGTLPLAAVKDIIQPQVLIRAKGKKLMEKMNAALNGASSIEQAAQKAGTEVVPLQNIVFANPILPGIAQENKVVGAVFGSQPNKLSKAIEGANGVYAFVVEGFTAPAPLTNSVKEKQQIGQVLLQRSDSEVFQILKDKANVKDFRANFF